MEYEWDYGDAAFWEALKAGEVPRDSDTYRFFMHNASAYSNSYDEMQEAVREIVQHGYSPGLGIGIKNLLQGLKTGEIDTIYIGVGDEEHRHFLSIHAKEEDQ